MAGKLGTKAFPVGTGYARVPLYLWRRKCKVTELGKCFLRLRTAGSAEEEKDGLYAMFSLQGKEAELFVYLSWSTHGRLPFLASDQARQAAFQAIATGTRLRFCRLLAIEATAHHIHLVCRFPASLSVSHLIGIAQTACASAVCRLWEIVEPGHSLPPKLWEPACTARTLHAMTEAEAKVYLRQQMTAVTQENQ